MHGDAQENPVIVADTGPLLRLAAASRLDALRLTGRQIIVVDMVEYEACHRDPERPCAREILAWLESSGAAVQRVETIVGIAFQALLAEQTLPDTQQKLKRMERDGGVRAVRDFIEGLDPRDVRSALVIYEDLRVPELVRATQVPLHVMTTTMLLDTFSSEDGTPLK